MQDSCIQSLMETLNGKFFINIEFLSMHKDN